MKGGKMTKMKPIKVVYNVNPDPITKITEYSYTGDGLKKVKETNFNVLAADYRKAVNTLKRKVK